MRNFISSLLILSLTSLCLAIVIKRSYLFEDLVGVWAGEEIPPEGTDYSSEWTAFHNEDASLEILFTIEEEGQTYRFKHHGTWGIQDDIYYSHIAKIIDEDQIEESVDFHFTYKIHALTENTFEYSSVDSGETFTSTRVR